MLTAMKIQGAIDAEGRCKHWHSSLDVVANKCATCGKYFACALCHAELTDHEFGPMLADAPFNIHPVRRRLRDNVLTVDWESVAPRD